MKAIAAEVVSLQKGAAATDRRVAGLDKKVRAFELRIYGLPVRTQMTTYEIFDVLMKEGLKIPDGIRSGIVVREAHREENGRAMIVSLNTKKDFGHIMAHKKNLAAYKFQNQKISITKNLTVEEVKEKTETINLMKRLRNKGIRVSIYSHNQLNVNGNVGRFDTFYPLLNGGASSSTAEPMEADH